MAIALRYAARSDLGLGPKSRNEDSGYAGPHLLVLADGMGGHAAGDVASSMIVGELAPLDNDVVSAEQAISRLEDGLRRANAHLSSAMKDNSKLRGMGSTTIALLRTGNKIALAHIGDSRAFLLRADTFAQITKDHSFVQQLVDEGRITREEASHHPQRSIVTRVMTGQPEDEPDTSLREAKLGDRFLLCSDGLSDFVGSEVIEEILRGAATPDEAATRLIEVALKASTRDNVTVIVADVVDAQGDTLPETVPQVVGAAAKRLRDKTRPIPTSPAAKAAALSREANRDVRRQAQRDGSAGAARDAGDDTDESVELAENGPPRGRKRLTRRLIGGALVTAVIIAGAYAAYDWSQRQFYVAADHDGSIALFRGVSAELGPLRLSHVEVGTDVPVQSLPTDLQGALGPGVPVTDRAGGELKIETLRLQAVLCQALAATGLGCGVSTTAPTSTPTTTSSTGTPSAAPSGTATTQPSGSASVTLSGPPKQTVTVTITARPLTAPTRAPTGTPTRAQPGAGAAS